MPRLFAPLRPKRPADEAIPEPLRTPAAPGLSPSNYAPEPVYLPAMPVKPEPTLVSQHLEQVDPPPVAELSQLEEACRLLPSVEEGYNDGAAHTLQHVEPPMLAQDVNAQVAGALAVDGQDCAPQPGVDNNTIPMWPSELHSHGSTMWLLPPYSDQSASIALILRTEIQSHNITRKTLHSTEQRRQEAVQRCNQFQIDARGWANAYNNLTAALGRCSAEFSRISAENIALKAEMQTIRAQQLDVATPKDQQIERLRERLSHRWNNDRPIVSIESVDGCDGRDRRDAVYGGSPCHSECSECPYSPEV